VDDIDVVDETAETPHSVAMRLLDAGVPLTLLFDLLSPEGPDSMWILETERAEPLPVR
jgi:hypothetical protein